MNPRHEEAQVFQRKEKSSDTDIGGLTPALFSFCAVGFQEDIPGWSVCFLRVRALAPPQDLLEVP